VSWLVDAQVLPVRQADRADEAVAFVGDRLAELDALLLELRHRRADVVAHEVELGAGVLGRGMRLLGGMHRGFDAT
jgi:hypothetical protein